MGRPIVEIRVKDFSGMEFRPRDVLLIGDEAWEVLFGKQGTPVRLVNENGEKSKVFFVRPMKAIAHDSPR